MCIKLNKIQKLTIISLKNFTKFEQVTYKKQIPTYDFPILLTKSTYERFTTIDLKRIGNNKI